MKLIRSFAAFAGPLQREKKIHKLNLIIRILVFIAFSNAFSAALFFPHVFKDFFSFSMRNKPRVPILIRFSSDDGISKLLNYNGLRRDACDRIERGEKIPLRKLVGTCIRKEVEFVISSQHSYPLINQIPFNFNFLRFYNYKYRK